MTDAAKRDDERPKRQAAEVTSYSFRRSPERLTLTAGRPSKSPKGRGSGSGSGTRRGSSTGSSSGSTLDAS